MPASELVAWAESPRTRADHDVLVDLSTTISDRAEALRAATGRPVVVQSPPKLGAAVADPRTVRTVLDHLLGNAVTYSEHGKPIVLSAASDRRWVRISVTDYGVGLTAEESARCFEAFWQAGAARTRGVGTGMGLFIVRTLVESMGGHVAVKTARGKGSTFTVALPRAKRGTARPRPGRGVQPGIGEDSSILEFMRQIGVPARRAI
jgi:two-component system sensor histidine kinase MtrB